MNAHRIILFTILVLIVACINAQQLNKHIKFTGDIGLYGDFYEMESDTINAVSPRRPAAVSRLVANATINIKNVSLPFTLSIPFQQHQSIILDKPATPKTPLINFIKNPQNRVGIAPKYKWLQLMLGSQIPQYSELSLGDYPVFGGGFNLTPGKFRISAFSGKSQIAIEEDPLNRIQGAYSRNFTSAKIGYGDEDSSHVHIIGCIMKDDTNSLIVRPTSLMPQAGVLGSIDYRVNIGKKTYIQGEIAASGYTRDLHSRTIDSFEISIPQSIYTPKESSRIDFATLIKAGTDFKNFGIAIIGRYYGDGFVPLGYPFMQTDRLEITANPRFSIFKKKVQFSGSIGQRVNNLSGIRATTTTQTIGSANINTQLSDKVAIAANYSNFGFRNALVNDTFRVQMVTQSWGINPSYTYTGLKSIHTVNVMYSQNIFRDFNTVSGELNDNNADNAVITYLYALLNNPLTASATVSYFSNHASFGRITTKALNLKLGYKFFEKKLTTNTGLTITDNQLNADPSGFQVMGTLGGKYSIKKKITLSATGSINLFEFGNTRPGISYRENLLRTSLTYKL